MIADNKNMNIENEYKLSMILDEINKLSIDDKELITNLLIKEKTERERHLTAVTVVICSTESETKYHTCRLHGNLSNVKYHIYHQSLLS